MGQQQQKKTVQLIQIGEWLGRRMAGTEGHWKIALPSI